MQGRSHTEDDCLTAFLLHGLALTAGQIWPHVIIQDIVPLVLQIPEDNQVMMSVVIIQYCQYYYEFISLLLLFNFQMCYQPKVTLEI